MLTRLYFAAAAVALLVAAIHAEYLDEPEELWSYEIPGAGNNRRRFRRKNAIQPSTSGYSIFCTAVDGSLHIVKPNDFESSIIVEPPDEDAECRGGVALYESFSEDGNIQVDFAVYAVMYNADNPDAATSRVISVTEGGTIRWVLELDGVVEGTPAIGSEKNDIYVVHNLVMDGILQGQVSIIRDNDGSPVVIAEINSSREVPFGPLTLKTSDDVLDGDDDIDVAFFGESTDEGYADDGVIYGLYPSNEYLDNDGEGSSSYDLRRVGDWERSIIARPTVSNNLRGLYIGGTSGFVGGWVEETSPRERLDSSNAIGPEWLLEVEPPEDDEDAPLDKAVTLGNSGEFLYFADNSFTLVCVNAASGGIEWWNDGDRNSGYTMEAKLSERENEIPVVYIIERETGNIRQHNARNGNVRWEYNCEDLTGDDGCEDDVEAEFNLDTSGNILFYGDIYGKITAIQVAEFPTPSPVAVPEEAPVAPPVAESLAPISSAPVFVSEAPVEDSVSEAPVDDPTVADPDPEDPVVDPEDTEGESEPNDPATEPEDPDSDPEDEPEDPDSDPEISDPDSDPEGGPDDTPVDQVPLPTPPPMQQPAIDSAIESPESGGMDSNSILLISLVSVLVVSSMLAACLAMLMVKKRRKHREATMDIQQREESEQIWRDQQQELEAEALRTEKELFGAAAVVTPPSKKKSQNRMSPGGTPSTLDSIEEGLRESPSVASSRASSQEDIAGRELNTSYELVPDISALTSQTRPSEKQIQRQMEKQAAAARKMKQKDASKARGAKVEEEKKDADNDDSSVSSVASFKDYIPTGLASTLDQVFAGFVGGGDTKKDEALDPDAQWEALAAKKSKGAMELGNLLPARSGDDSSIGSDSLFIDEESLSKSLDEAFALQNLATQLPADSLMRPLSPDVMSADTGIVSKATTVHHKNGDGSENESQGNSQTGSGLWDNLMAAAGLADVASTVASIASDTTVATPDQPRPKPMRNIVEEDKKALAEVEEQAKIDLRRKILGIEQGKESSSMNNESNTVVSDATPTVDEHSVSVTAEERTPLRGTRKPSMNEQPWDEASLSQASSQLSGILGPSPKSTTAASMRPPPTTMVKSPSTSTQISDLVIPPWRPDSPPPPPPPGTPPPGTKISTSMLPDEGEI